MRVARYARVSRKEQSRDSSALERQLFRLDRQVRSFGIEPDNNLLFVDVQSGRKDDRPDFEKLLALFSPRQIDRLVIDRCDRITRHAEMNARLAKMFEQSGIELWEILKGRAVDFANPTEWEQFMIAGVQSEGEVRMLSKRIRDGFEYFRHQQKANPGAPWGYLRQDERYRLDLSIPAARAIEIIRSCGGNMAEACRQIDTELGKRWTPAGLGRWVMSPVLCGHTPYQNISSKNYGEWGRIAYNTHPDDRLLTDADQDGIRHMMGSTKAAYRTGSNQQRFVYALSSLLVCGRCGYRMGISRSHSVKQDKYYHYAYCRSRSRKIASLPCYNAPGKGVSIDLIEQAVILALCQRSAEIAEAAAVDLDAEEAAPNPQVLKLLRQIQQIEAMIGEMGDEDGLLNQKLVRLKAQAQALNNQNGSIDLGVRTLFASVGTDPGFWTDLNARDRQQLFRRFINKVVIIDGVIQSIDMRV